MKVAQGSQARATCRGGEPWHPAIMKPTACSTIWASVFAILGSRTLPCASDSRTKASAPQTATASLPAASISTADLISLLEKHVEILRKLPAPSRAELTE